MISIILIIDFIFFMIEMHLRRMFDSLTVLIMFDEGKRLQYRYLFYI